MIYITHDDGTKNIVGRWAKEVEWVRVFRTGVYPDTSEAEITDRVRQARGFLDKFNPTEDRLLLAGDPVLISICVAAVARNHRRFTVLKYDRENSAYYSMEINFGHD